VASDTNVSDFGTLLWPPGCAEGRGGAGGLAPGTRLWERGPDAGAPLSSAEEAARLRSCAGGVVARGRNADVFVLKYSASDGRGEWLKRLGQLDSHEEVLTPSP
jgi:hypothetical protein